MKKQEIEKLEELLSQSFMRHNEEEEIEGHLSYIIPVFLFVDKKKLAKPMLDEICERILVDIDESWTRLKNEILRIFEDTKSR